jgi:hypothetical protein
MEYLTPQDFETAKKNGISEERAKARFYKLGWTKQRTITQKTRKPQHDWFKYKDKSLVSMQTFYQRIKKGMSPEEAALTPPVPLGGRLDRPMKITKEHIERAAKNGIKAATLNHRVYGYRWDVERAVTEPINERYRSKKKSLRSC